MQNAIQRIKCIFGKHKVSPYAGYERYGVRFKKCVVCGKILKTQSVKFGTIL